MTNKEYTSKQLTERFNKLLKIIKLTDKEIAGIRVRIQKVAMKENLGVPR